jgi:hypothetical protein
MTTPSGLTYIGSTCRPTLAQRKAKHKGSYKCWKKGTHHFETSFKLFEEDENNVVITLLESYPCKNKDELEARERYYIENNTCVNKNIPTRTRKEYFEAIKPKTQEYHKQYQEQNKEKLKEQRKDYNIKNKDIISEKRKVKYQCECGSICRIRAKARHDNSKKHQSYISTTVTTN